MIKSINKSISWNCENIFSVSVVKDGSGSLKPIHYLTDKTSRLNILKAKQTLCNG